MAWPVIKRSLRERVPERQRASRRWYVAALLLAGCLGGMAVVWPWIERKMIFFPATDVYQTPAVAGITFEEVTFTAADGPELHGWFLPARSAERAAGRAILFSHGNAGNMADRVDWLSLVHRGVDAHILAYDYRGYGRSTGVPGEEGLYKDAQAALEALRNRPEVDAARVLVLGRSLGGGVTAELAVREIAAGRPPAAVVLESTFTSMTDMASAVFPVLPGLGRVMSTRFDNLAKVPTIRKAGVPMVVIHGDVDELIPVAMAHQVAAAAGVDPIIIRRGGHNNAWHVGGMDGYVAPIQGLLDKI